MGREPSCLDPADSDDGMPDEAVAVVHVEDEGHVVTTGPEEVPCDPCSRCRVVDPGGGRLSPASGTASGWDAVRQERPVSARKKEWSGGVGAIVVPSRNGGFMEVTHATGHGGGPRGRPSPSHGLRPEPTRRGSTPTDPKPPELRGARGPAAPPSSHRISPRPGHIPSRPTGTRDAGSVVTRKNPKVENGPFDRPRWPGRDFPTSAGHPTKISPIGGRSSRTASEVRCTVTTISPGQRPNLDYRRPPEITGQTGQIGLITRRSNPPRIAIYCSSSTD